VKFVKLVALLREKCIGSMFSCITLYAIYVLTFCLMSLCFRPNQIHEIRTITIDVLVAWVSVCLFVFGAHTANKID